MEYKEYKNIEEDYYYHYFYVSEKVVKVDSTEFSYFLNTSIFYDDFLNNAVGCKYVNEIDGEIYEEGVKLYEFEQETFDWWMERIEKLYEADEKKDDISEYDGVEWASDIIKAYRDELDDLSTTDIEDFVDDYFELVSETLEKLTNIINNPEKIAEFYQGKGGELMGIKKSGDSYYVEGLGRSESGKTVDAYNKNGECYFFVDDEIQKLDTDFISPDNWVVEEFYLAAESLGEVEIITDDDYPDELGKSPGYFSTEDFLETREPLYRFKKDVFEKWEELLWVNLKISEIEGEISRFDTSDDEVSEIILDYHDKIEKFDQSDVENFLEKWWQESQETLKKLKNL